MSYKERGYNKLSVSYHTDAYSITTSIHKDDVRHDKQVVSPSLTVRIIILIICAASLLFEGLNASIHAPFFPENARAKGATYSDIGFITGVVFAALAGGSLLVGALNTPETTKFFFVMGMLLSGTTMMLFGVLGFSKGGILYVITCSVCRLLMGLGAAAVYACSFPVIGNQFPNMVGRTTSLLQVASGFGLMFGPSIGSVLFLWKGYLAPFLMAGVMESLLGVLSIIFLPQLGGKSEEIEHLTISKDDLKEHQTEVTFLGFLKCANLWKVTLPCLALAATMGFRDASFTNFMYEQMDEKNPAVVGLLFTLSSLAYTVSALITGIFVDRGYAGPVLTLGLVVVPVVPVMLYLTQYFQVTVAFYCAIPFILVGLTYGTFCAPSMLLLEKATIAKFVHEHDELFLAQIRLMVSAWYSVTRALGRCVGSFLFGGFLLDMWGVYNTMFAFAVYLAVTAFLSVVFIAKLNFWNKTRFTLVED